MKKVYKVWGIHPKAKKRKLPMPCATAVTSLEAQPGSASHENAFPDALEPRDAMKCQDHYLKEKKENCKTQLVSKDVRILWKSHLPRPDTTLVECIKRFHVRTLKAVKKVVNRDERRLRAENEEKSTLSIMLTGGMSKDRVHRSVGVLTSREGPRNEKARMKN